MSVIKTISATPLDAVSIENTDGPFTHVWLRRNIEKDTADNGPDGEPYEFYAAEELYFKADGTPTVAELTERFDELWAEHEDDGKTQAERMAELSQQIADTNAAVLELGDLMGGDE